jgi:formate dehydrogenase major subunit
MRGCAVPVPLVTEKEEGTMGVTRREFLKLSGGAALAAGTVGLAETAPAEGGAPGLRIEGAKKTTTICPFCAVGCGILVYTKDGKVVNTEGDPDHPVNEGTLCSKGSSLFQIANNPLRLAKPKYRAPGASEWKDVEWEWALEEIAKRVKSARDRTFKLTSPSKVKEKQADGTEKLVEQQFTVNRTDAIAHVGSAALDNEEAYLLQKLLRSWGIVYLEHQARICHSSTVPALAETFGRGAMTNHWIDIRNSDVILIMGANPAENHPISMKWAMRVKERGAKLIVVDPRFTRTAARADVYAQMRTGTDIAFLGGMIKYILDHHLYFREYVVNYTSAPFLVDPEFKGPGELDGLFSGYDEATRKYDKQAWSFQMDENGMPKKDPTLANPHSVFQLLKKHYSRYTLEMVSSITGTPKEKLEEVYKLYGSTGTRDRAGTEMYAVGWTQHTVGTQNIRTMAMIQLLLGNIGMAGGGVNALRGESNVQGATDHGVLFNLLPGYLAYPTSSIKDLGAYIEKYTPKTKDPKSVNWWSNRNKYIVSYLKAIYGKSATKENDFGYAWLPKLDEGMDCSWLMLFDKMHQGQFEGFFAWGQNPACSSANAGKVRAALSKLKWMVNVNLFDNETGSFWKGPGMNPQDVQTEVFLLPAASSIEKEGSVTNSGRWSQWRYRAVAPVGESKPDSEIMNDLWFHVRRLYQKEGGKYSAPILNLTWNYGEKDGQGRITKFNIHNVAKEINGYYLEDVYDKTANPPKLLGKKGDICATFVHLQADGTTSCGNWVFSQSYTTKDGKNVNMMARRGKSDPTGLGMYPEWSWSWPVNRRILYNRASVDPAGRPWNPKRAVIKWDANKPDPVSKKPGMWVGDVPDGPAPPMSAEKGKLPFIMLANGVGSLFGPGLADGPFPEHYEALESPLAKNLLSGQRINPAVRLFTGKADAFFFADERYPLVATTYRVSEHWQTGVLTRHEPWQLELQPQQYVEISEELAREKGIRNGEKVVVKSARGEIRCVAMVTQRFATLTVNGRKTHQIGMPWCFGWQWPADGSGGDSSNLLTPNIGDANTMIPETKTFMANVEKA